MLRGMVLVYLCKKIIDLHNGTISVSELGVGSSFKIIFDI